MLNRKLQVRLISPWSPRLETEKAVFIRDLPVEKADALLCNWAPHAEIFTFPRRKAWYCCEPRCQFDRIEAGRWPSYRKQLKDGEFLYHGHLDPRFRVPHTTHFEPLQMRRSANRRAKAVAIVSNQGGGPRGRHPDISYRNSLITSPSVDLYGRSSWNSYRDKWYSIPKAPRNYRGEIPGDWPAEAKRELMMQYKVCVCLENMNEPGYFTEKMVEAVVAGCIPVYRASADVRDTFLKGAYWFDPTDPRWPGVHAIDAALEAKPEPILEQNRQWILESAFLHSSHSDAVFAKITDALLCEVC
jgi:hypothetical protein